MASSPLEQAATHSVTTERSKTKSASIRSTYFPARERYPSVELRASLISRLDQSRGVSMGDVTSSISREIVDHDYFDARIALRGNRRQTSPYRFLVVPCSDYYTNQRHPQ